MKQGDLCPRWPCCHCIVQGYVNQFERDDCGAKPASTKKGLLRQQRADFIRVLGRKAWDWRKRHNPHLFA